MNESTSGARPAPPVTPAMIYDQAVLEDILRQAKETADASGATLLYSLKACSLRPVLEIIRPYVGGFSCSSPNEVRLAESVADEDQSLHFTSPGIRPDDAPFLLETCDYITFNSLSQFDRFAPHVPSKTKVGLRVNPELHFVSDIRYAPCRPHSKLGVTCDAIANAFRDDARLARLDGLHFHTNCESETFQPLLKTVRYLIASIPEVLERINWLNLGGGYYLHEDIDRGPLCEAVGLLRERFDLHVLMEPGGGIVAESGSLVSSVLDRFETGGKQIAVLDTSVNHLPEIFEYGFRPDIAESVEPETANRPVFSFLLAGTTCLAGDIFGEYTFLEPLAVGAAVTLCDQGAYSLVKAHMFNGVNLPTLFLRNPDGRLSEIKRFTHDDFLARNGRNE